MDERKGSIIETRIDLQIINSILSKSKLWFFNFSPTNHPKLLRFCKHLKDSENRNIEPEIVMVEYGFEIEMIPPK